MDEGLNPQPGWSPYQGSFHRPNTDSLRGSRQNAESKSLLVTDIPPLVEEHRSVNITTSSGSKHKGTGVRVPITEREYHHKSHDFVDQQQPQYISHERVHHSPTTQHRDIVEEKVVRQSINRNHSSHPQHLGQDRHRSVVKETYQTSPNFVNHSEPGYSSEERIRHIPITPHRGAIKEKVIRTNTERTPVSHRQPLHLNLDGVDSSQGVSNNTRVYTIDSPVTPTKYTYNYTASFDSGISELDLSKPQSPLNRSRSSLKEVHTQSGASMSARHSQKASKENDPRFLKKVQRELEDQRSRWEHEVDQLSSSVAEVSMPTGGKVEQQGQNSYVDTSSGHPIFKAFVDVSSYPKKGVSVNIDALANVVTVTAARDSAHGNVKRTFSQKVSLPRYADEARMTSHLSKKGIIKIEVPLLYYFARPDDAKARDRKAKSFVYQVEANGSGERVLEILVNTGAEFRAKDLKILVQDDNKLLVMGLKTVTNEKTGQLQQDEKLIKQYTLPDNADVDHITSKLGKDGRLQVNVPIIRD